MINCAYARTAIRELTPKVCQTRLYGRDADKQKRISEFQSLFNDNGLSESLFTINQKGDCRFDHACDKILDNFSKKWYPNIKDEYEKTFSIHKWKELATTEKKKHTVSFCSECSKEYPKQQRAFPGKPVFEHTPAVTLELPSTSQKEKHEVRSVLRDLNSEWTRRHGHSFSSVIPKLAPEENLTKKQTKVEKKKHDRIQKRTTVKKINEHFKEGLALTLLAEAESMQSYTRKRFAMSFTRPEEPNKKAKLHSPSEENQAWSHDEAAALLESHPVDKKINWSDSARKLRIPGTNNGQVLKEFAVKRGFDVVALERKCSPTPTRIRRKKKRLPCGEILIPALPPPQIVTTEKQKMISNGTLSLGEPCTPYTVHKTVVTSDGEVNSEEVEIVGRKISLVEIRKKLLEKHSQYMRLMTNEEIDQLDEAAALQFLTLAHCPFSHATPLSELKKKVALLQRTRTLALWHDHSTVLRQGYVLFAVKVIYDRAVFLTETELPPNKAIIENLQEVIEQPMIYIIAPSTSSLAD